MRDYEALFIIKPDLEEEQTTAVANKFAGLIGDNGGEIIKVERWGKRRLAYEVKKYNEGVYVLLRFKALPAVPLELERVLKISDDILKYLVTRQELKTS
ncbi:MAG: 30S ribosomal protein S6 [Bacillota bacterium]